MNEFFAMGGYGFYVWSSMGLFALAMLADFISLRRKEQLAKRNIKSYLRRKQNKN